MLVIQILYLRKVSDKTENTSNKLNQMVNKYESKLN